MTKRQQKEIRRIANKLPKIKERYREFAVGRKEIRSIVDKGRVQGDGELTINKKIKNLYVEKYRTVNHYRRLKRAFDRHGSTGIKVYVDSVTKIVAEHNENKRKGRGEKK